MTTEIDSNVPLEPAKPKPRGRRQASGKAKNFVNPAAGLIAALKFVSVAQKKAGPTNIQFCMMLNHWVVANDGILTVGCKIEEDLSACPHTYQLLDALSKIGEELSITQISAGTLAVTSNPFRGLVPCVTHDELPMPIPDPAVAVIDDRVKAALAAVLGLATEGAPHASHAGVLLQANTAAATNGAALLEAWHGVDLPPGLLMPKAAAVAIAKSSKTLVGFGFSQSSATFYFDDESFIKTQLFAERFSEYGPIFDVPELNLWPVPEDFFKAVRAVESFNERSNVYFENGLVMSSASKETASTYKIDGLPEGMAFSAKYLLLVEHAFTKADFNQDRNNVIFYGDNVRGALAPLKVNRRVEGAYNNYDPDDDIPF